MSYIDCVLVTYNPDIDLLQRAIKSIVPQIRTLYIIDNCSKNDITLIEHISDNISIKVLDENIGIAAAQNIGIKYSLNNSAEFIMLSDQDTIYPNDYVDNMLLEIKDNTAACVPMFFDVNQNNSPAGFIVDRLFRFKKIIPSKGKYELLHAIASGKILISKHLNEIGLMDENLFIDWVDLEWCWRANKKGYKVVGNAEVRISHQLGDKARNVGIRNVPLRSYIRHYYITRNAFYLSLNSKSLNMDKKIRLFIRSFRYIIFFPLLSNEKKLNLRYVTKGFIDGICGKLGKIKL
jgi:rhamnosyltransferase